MRRRAERLREIWSDEVRFSALEEQDEEPGTGGDDDWDVTFPDRVSCRKQNCFEKSGNSRN